MSLFLDIRSKINLDRMGKVNVLVAAVSEINKPIFLRLRTTEIKWRDANGHERIHDTRNPYHANTGDSRHSMIKRAKMFARVAHKAVNKIYVESTLL